MLVTVYTGLTYGSRQVFSVQILSTWLICTVIYILNRENKNNSLTVETFIKEIKKRSNFLDKNLILQYLFKIKRYIKVMLGADKTHNMLIIFRRKNSVFSVCCPAHLYYVWQIIYFDFCCKLLNFSVIIDGY